VPGRRPQFVPLCVAAIAFSLASTSAVAHAVLVESSPAPKSSVAGPDIPLKLRFNVRIDPLRSRLTLVSPDGSLRTLEINQPALPDAISSQAKGLQPGEYRLRWQVLASDGHITRGEIPFTVVHS